MNDDDDARARARALDENARRSRVMADAQQSGPPVATSCMTCTRTAHPEWAMLYDDHGRPFALACPVCMATVPVPEAEPGVRLVPLPLGWEDEDT